MRAIRQVLLLCVVVTATQWPRSGEAAGLLWTQCANVPANKQWQAIACSADGAKLVAASWGGGIYTSSDSGQTWASNNIAPQNYWCVASSADGTKLAATVSGSPGASIWASKNSGTNWYRTGAATGGWQNYMGIASSADGTKLAATGAYAPNRYVYFSSDGGTNWNPTDAPTARSWYYITCSEDGTKLLGVAWNYPSNFTSIDSGATWISHPVPTNYWYAATSSADGSKLTEVAQSGAVFTSTNAGATWFSNCVPNETWNAATSSADGTTIAIAGYGALYTSFDSGQTWVSNDIPVLAWVGIASSADGRKIIAVAYTGEIYTATPAPPILGVSLSSTNLTLTWSATATNYSLQQTKDFIHGLWTDVTNAASKQNGQQQVTLIPKTNQVFYRLKGN